MTYKISEMSQETAEFIAYQWKYPAPYDFYDIANDEQDFKEFINPRKREDRYFEVWEKNKLIGFFCVKSHLEEKAIELGLGMHPDEVGKGKGEPFVKEILSFIADHYNCETILLYVALFNNRAINVYKKCGFKPLKQFLMETNGQVVEFLGMGMKMIHSKEEKR